LFEERYLVSRIVVGDVSKTFIADCLVKEEERSEDWVHLYIDKLSSLGCEINILLLGGALSTRLCIGDIYARGRDS